MHTLNVKLNDLTATEVQTLLADAWLNTNLQNVDFWNPLANFPSICEDNPEYYLTWLLSQPEYFHFICKELLNIDIYPMQGVILQTLWNHKFPILIASRGAGKSWILALYAILRMLLLPGRKIIIAGSAFRQSKVIFEYMEGIWNNAPLLRSMCGGNSKEQGPFHNPDMWSFKIGRSVAKAIPIGSGEKIRGQRAHDIINDEMSSINREIFEVVIAGFAAVSATPIENMRTKATERLAQYLKIKLPAASTLADTKDNQIIMSGTAHYAFNHFAEYWRQWCAIIGTKDNPDELRKVFNGSIPKGLKASDYSVLRIPVDFIPEGFMEDAQVARSKATVQSDVFLREFGAVFAKDSNGFYKRSLIETCIASSSNNILDSNNEPIVYYPTLRGDAGKKYVIAIDPASEVDNFAIVIVELHDNHRRIVYCWTTNKKDFRERQNAGLITESNFYAFTARKIRELIKLFPCTHVMMDSQGGGQAVLEALHDRDKLKTGEQLIWETIVPGDQKSTDGEAGLHIVELVNFADAKWVNEANHGLKKDLGDKACLFPGIDAIEVAKAMADTESLYDTMEDCIFEIEELKNELSIIIMTKTATGRDKWDTPDSKIPGTKKGQMTKDRYSALLMANMAARQYLHAKPITEHNTEGGWMHDYDEKMKGPSYQGPAWASDILNNLYE